MGVDNQFNEEASLEAKLSCLEEMATGELLVELLNAKKAEVFENVVFQGQKRYYIEDLSQRDYFLENTTPYQIEISGNVIEEHVWGKMICRVIDLLLQLFPCQKDQILNFHCPWSKAVMVTSELKTNFRALECGYYVNCNHTALHSCWFIQDILDFFGIDKSSVSLLIYRPSSAEPKHVKEYIEKRFKRNYGNAPFDLDYNLYIISMPDEFWGDLRKLKETVRCSLNKAVGNSFFSDGKDSTSVITSILHFNDSPKVEFSFDVAILAKNSDGDYCRLIHNKNYGIYDQWTWCQVHSSKDVRDKAIAIKENSLWGEVRAKYLDKKNMYLLRGDTNHPSFVVYVESVNEIYNKYFD